MTSTAGSSASKDPGEELGVDQLVDLRRIVEVEGAGEGQVGQEQASQVLGRLLDVDALGERFPGEQRRQIDLESGAHLAHGRLQVGQELLGVLAQDLVQDLVLLQQ